MTAELSFEEFGTAHSDLKRNHAETVPAIFVRSRHAIGNVLNGFDRHGLEAAGTGPGPTSQLEHPLRVRLEYFVKVFVRIHCRILITVVVERHAMCDFADVTIAGRHRA